MVLLEVGAVYTVWVAVRSVVPLHILSSIENSDTPECTICEGCAATLDLRLGYGRFHYHP